MCGIAGFWSGKSLSQEPVDLLNRMGNSLAHRGPDDSGTFFDRRANLGFSFRRLSIIDLTEEGHQPMASASGRYTIVFNGEVYNYEEIRAEIGRQPWRGHSDTEVVLAAVERWGLEASVRRLVGMFAIALWDKAERRLHLVRDRIGIKPLYYGFIDGSFVFASELKAIRIFPGFQPAIDRDALAAYMRCAYVPGPHSIYQGIYQLQPGKILTLHAPGETPVVTAYWSAADVARNGVSSPLQGSDEEIVEELQNKLVDAVRLRMTADVPLGAFLSGGIDSSTVVALMQSQSSRPVKTFTIGFHEDEYNEAGPASKIARHLGTDHTELFVSPADALAVVPLLPSIYDEPFADSSQIPTHLVSKLARRDVTVVLSGDGGDELFCGYTRYQFVRSLWNILKKVPGPAAKSTADVVRLMPVTMIDRIMARLPVPSRFKSSPGEKIHRLADHLTARDPKEIYLRTLTMWPDPSAVVLDSREHDALMQSLAQFADIGTVSEMAMLTDLTNYLPGDILSKVDRASMAVALEVRVPVLDHRVVEFAWRLPLRLKIRNSNSKWALRQVLDRYVPAELVERPKMGFGVPIDLWLRGPLREWAEDLLSPHSLAQDGFFAVRLVREKWQEHVSGQRNWQYMLWPVLMFQAWIAAARSGSVQPEKQGTFVSGLRSQLKK